MARVQVCVQLLDHGEVCRASIFVQAFKVERKAMIDRECCEEALELLTDLVAFGRVLDEIAHPRVPALSVGVEVVEVRKDFSIFAGLLNDALDLVVFIGVVNCAGLEDGEFVAIGSGSLKVKRRRIEVQPLREE